MTNVSYKPDGRVLRNFMRSNDFVEGIRGPVGSGKSVACCMKMFMRAAQQEPSKNPDGEGKHWRKTRHAIVRNTNPQLRTTTIKTWLDWFPEDQFGQFRWSIPYTHHIKIGDIDAEFIFLAMDREDDVRKLLSLDLTYIWVNEAREVEKSIIDVATTRVGRYPSEKDGGPTNHGMIMDTNAPEDDHWWPIMAGDVPPPEYLTQEELNTLVKPHNWSFFNQPPGMLEIKDEQDKVITYGENPKAENIKHLVADYYPNLITGKRKNWIDVYVLNKIGSSEAGKAVYNAEFNKEIHVLKRIPPQDKMAEIIIGVDFGNTPAAIFAERDDWGTYKIFKEIVTANVKIQIFAGIVKHAIQRLGSDVNVVVYGDPAGATRDQQQSTACRLMRAGGVPVITEGISNDIDFRIETVANMLNKNINGQPAIQISPACKVLIKGFENGYKYKRMRTTTGPVYADQPMKNRFSHPHDALQYLLIGAGEGQKMVTKGVQQNKTFRMKRGRNPWGFTSSIRKRRAASR